MCVVSATKPFNRACTLPLAEPRNPLLHAAPIGVRNSGLKVEEGGLQIESGELLAADGAVISTPSTSVDALALSATSEAAVITRTRVNTVLARISHAAVSGKP